MTHALAGRPIRSRMQRPASGGDHRGRPARRFRGSRSNLVGRPDPGRSSSAGPEHMFWLVNYSLNLGFAQSWAVERMFRTDVPELVFPEHLFDGCATASPMDDHPVGAASDQRSCMGAAPGSCVCAHVGAASGRPRELRRRMRGSCAFVLPRSCVRPASRSCVCGSCAGPCQIFPRELQNAWELHHSRCQAAANVRELQQTSRNAAAAAKI